MVPAKQTKNLVGENRLLMYDAATDGGVRPLHPRDISARENAEGAFGCRGKSAGVPLPIVAAGGARLSAISGGDGAGV